MKVNLHLHYNKAFQWYVNDTIFLKGYFFYENNFYEKENALLFLSKITSLKDLLKKINGVFTILKKENNKMVVINDITRSFPIFYTKIDSFWSISDDIDFLKSKLKTLEFNKVSENEFLASNHVHGSKTLLENIYQTQSSEYISFTENDIEERFFYFSYSCEKQDKINLEKLSKDGLTVFENSFERTIHSCNNRQVVIPLSSGFDSRLIAVFFKKHNYKNVLCYTYGKKNSFEIEYSKKTSQALNFKWIFIEYDEKLTGEFLKTDNFIKYSDYAAKGVSMPNLQEYFAVKYLTDNKIIDDDAIFIPGYAGDILGGSEYKYFKKINFKTTTLEEIIFNFKMINKKFFTLEKEITLREIKSNLKAFDKDYSKKIPETVLDDYNLKERIAKYIFNSASFYTFFGHEFRFPFWDLELLSFFKTLPINLKEENSFFNDFLKKQYFEPFQVAFENKVVSKKNNFKIIKTYIKAFLPKFIKQKRLEKRDWNNYKLITKPMYLTLKKNGLKISRTYKDYNEIITQWYLLKMRNKL